MATTAPPASRSASSYLANTRKATAFHWLVSVVTVALLIRFFAAASLAELDLLDTATWIAAALIGDLLCVRLGQGVVLSMSLPVLLAAALLHEPAVAALIGFLACLDAQELRGGIPVERALFNRSQIALSVGLASAVMARFGGASLHWPEVVVIAAAGLAADSLVNVALVTASTVLSGRASVRETVVGLWGAEPAASLGLYGSMCLIAPFLALIFISWGPWALLACTGLLVPFRLALVKIEELGTTANVVRLREAALRKAQEAANRERHEERLSLAGDLHDEVLPALFKVHLMGEVIKQDLATGRLLDLDDDLPELLMATSAAQNAVRGVVGDLRIQRDSARGVTSAIKIVADQLDGDGKPRFMLRLADIRGAQLAERTVVQVAREAMVNGSRYSEASRIVVELREEDGTARLEVADDGCGFDQGQVDTAVHFGLQLMKERVEAAGGTLTLSSSKGNGTVLVACIPLGELEPD